MATSWLKLCTIKGQFKLGSAAKAVKGKAGAQIVHAEMTEKTYVYVTADEHDPDADTGIPDKPIPLDAALRCLQATGYFPSIYKHICEQQEDMFRVKPQDDVVFQPDVIHDPVPSMQTLDENNLSTKINYLALKCCQMVQVLRYNKELCSLRQGAPTLYLPPHLRMKAGEIYQL